MHMIARQKGHSGSTSEIESTPKLITSTRCPCVPSLAEIEKRVRESPWRQTDTDRDVHTDTSHTHVITIPVPPEARG